MATTTLIPNPRIIELEGFVDNRDSITIRMRSTQTMAACPRCDQRSKRVHSRYARQMADLPWHGVAVKLYLRVRKFFCENALCSQKIFTERLADVVRPYGRQTIRLERVLRYIGFVSGGEEGARISRELNAPVSADAMIRGIRAPKPRRMSAPRVLGIDEFAFRKGYRYGTILVDLERRDVIELLPDRNPDTVALWLKGQPQIEIISRDRSNSFTEAANRGAPHASQVADRWHLVKNIGEALTRLVYRNSKLLREATQSEQTAPVVVESESKADELPADLSKAQKQAGERRERRLDRYNEIIRLRAAGAKIREIARRVGVDVRTVRRFLRADGFPERAKRKAMASVLDPFKPYLMQRWEEGCHNAAKLCREITEKGFTGRMATVRQFLARLRKSRKKDIPNTPRQSPAIRSVRQVAFLLTEEKLDERERTYLDRLFQLCPQMERASSLAKEFSRMVRGQRADRLDSWLGEAQESDIPDLATFAKGLGQDIKAVKAALSSEWSNGQVEGQVNRLKTIKRQMYGRANFDLLRQRVLGLAA